MAEAQLAGTRHLVLAGAAAPVAFFAYPGRPSYLVPPDCQVHVLAGPGEDVAGALEALADRVVADRVGAPPPAGRARALFDLAAPGRNGPLSAEAIGAVVGARLPDGAIMVEEAITANLGLAAGTAGAPPHDWLGHTGGAIGQGLPVATGAAVAGPGDGWSAYRPMAAPCTPSRPCGPRPGKAST